MRRTWKRAFSLFLSLVMCLSLFPAPAFAEGDVAEEAAEPVILSESEGSQATEPPLEGEVAAEQPEGSEPVALDAPEDTEEPADPVIPSDSEGSQETDPADEDAVIDLQPLTDVELDGLGTVNDTQGENDTPSVPIETDEDLLTSGTCGDNLTWSFDEETGTLTISGTGAMTNWDSDRDKYAPWKESGAPIQHVIVEDGVTSIGSEAFLSLSSITSVVLPASVSTIGDFAFSGCTGITGFTLPAGLRYVGEDGLSRVRLPERVEVTFGCGAGALANCGIKELVLPEGFTTSDGVFANNPLEVVHLPKSITYISEAAFFCNGSGTVYYAGSEADRENITIRQSNGWLTDSAWIYAESSIVASGECGAQGDNLTWTLYDNGELVISGSGEMANYLLDNMPWYSQKSDVKSLVIGDGVTSVGNFAFNGCSSLTSVTFPNSVTSIGASAFSGCSGLTSITIPDGVTSIGRVAFSYCSGLTTITLPDSLNSIDSNAFSGCSSLTSITLPESLISICGYAFEGCSGLTSVTLPEGVTSIGAHAFYGCSGLTSIIIPDSVTSIGMYAFYGCSSLTGITLPANLTSIEDGTFYECSVLASITIPEGVTSIWDEAFMGCIGLTSITFPQSVTTIGEFAFVGCNALTDVYYGGTEAQKNELVGNGWSTSTENDPFYNATWHYAGPAVVASGECGAEGDNLTWTLYDNGELSISGEGDMADYYNSQKTVPWYSQRSDIRSVAIGDGVTSVGDFAFYECRSLTSITIPESVASIGRGSFYGCRSLTSITLPEGVTSIGRGSFADCSNLTSITLPESLTSIDYGAFSNCSSLTSITLPESVTSIGDRAFEYCSGLTSITIPESVTSIGNEAFQMCSGLTSITLPAGLTSIGGYAFQMCSGLTSITLPAGLTNIGGRAFSGCSGLTSVTIPEGLTSIGNAFFSCSNLTSITLPDSLTSIDYDAFSNCSSLTSITLPESVTSIGDRAFEYCSGLTSITIPESVTSIGVNAFDSCGALTDVYYGGTEEQKNALVGNGWSTTNNDSFFTATWHYAGPATSGECGDPGSYVTWSFDAATGTLTISGSGAMADFGSAGSPWYELRESIQKVVIESGVTSIGDYAIGYCPNLREITVPDSVTSIGTGAFHRCWSLEAITIPYGVSEIKLEAFSECRSLTNVVLPETVQTIEDFGFFACSGLQTITLPEGLSSIGARAFESCDALTDVYFGGSATLAQQRQGDGGDWSLDGNWTLYNANWHYAKKDTLASGECGAQGDNLTWVLYDNGELVISGTGNMKNYSEKSMPWADYRDKIQRVVIESGVKTIGNYAFYSCQNLKSVDLPEGLTRINSNAFSYCRSLTSVTFPESLSNIGSSAFCYCTKLGSAVLPEGLKTIGDSAFSCCSGLTSITFPSSLTKIENNAFCDCSSLVEVVLPDSVTTIGYYVFSGCSSLTSVTLPANLTTIESYMFMNCSSLTSITIPECVTSIDWSAFENCSSLRSLVLPVGLTRIDGRTFKGCSSLTEIAIPAGVTWIGDYAFNECSGLLKLTIPEGVTTIGHNAFQFCDSVESVTLPASLTTISDNAFDGCYALTTVTYGGTEAQKTDLTGNGWSTTGNDPLFNATWTCAAPGTFTVAYDANGGYNAPDAQEKVAGETIVLSSDRPSRDPETVETYTVTLDPTGGSVEQDTLWAYRTATYSFLAWNTEADGSGDGYEPGMNYTANESVTLFAQWDSVSTVSSVTLPTPTREGYIFNGWATSAAAASGRTGSYVPVADVTFYATWKAAPVISGTLTVGSAVAQPGKEVTVSVNLSENPGVALLGFYVEYDKDRLKLVGYEDGSLTGWLVSVGLQEKALWSTHSNSDESGEILKLRFLVLEDAPEGDAVISLTRVEANTEKLEYVSFAAENGAVSVKYKFSGDVNGDGLIDGLDVTCLTRWYAGFPETINELNADVNADGVVDGLDVTLLTRWYAGFPEKLQ